VADIIQIRRDTSSNWTSVNPTLAQGELGVETNTSKIKIGDGTTAWNSLAYIIDPSTYITTSGTQTLTNKTIITPILTGYFETVFTITDGGSVDLDPANGTIQVWTLGASRTPTATNFAAGESMTLMIDDGSAYTVTWTSVAVTWVGGSAPTLATTGYTVIELWKVGSTIYGSLVGNV
jgi:hypothetical protein